MKANLFCQRAFYLPKVLTEKCFEWSGRLHLWNQLYSVRDTITISFLMCRWNVLRLLCQRSWTWLSRPVPNFFCVVDCTVYLLVPRLSFFCNLIGRNRISWLVLCRRLLLWAHVSRHWHFPVFCLLWDSPPKLKYLIIIMLWGNVCRERR